MQPEALLEAPAWDEVRRLRTRRQAYARAGLTKET